MNIVEIKKLTKKYKDLIAVDHISFNVEKGEIFGFLGPNGAGKSTTISMLSTLLTATEGEAKINNFNITTQRNDVRRSIGLVFQDPSLDDRLTAEENLWFHARLYGVPKSEYAKRSKEVLGLVDLWDRRDDIVRDFSGGMKRRLEIARGLIHYPVVLFLDEPTIGLDPQTRSHLWEYIMKLKKEKQMTIFMTTHYMDEAEYCDRIAIIDHGKIVALDTPLNLKKLVGGDIISISSRDNKALKKELEEIHHLTVKEEKNILYFEVAEGNIFIPHLLHGLKTPIDSIEMRRPALDDVFLNLTGKNIREHEASGKEKMQEFIRMRRP